jgi:hypothetical protein
MPVEAPAPPAVQTPPPAPTPAPSKVSPEFLKRAGILPKEPPKPAEPPPVPEPVEPPPPAEPPQPTPTPTDQTPPEPKPQKKPPKVAKGYAQPPQATIEQITAAATAAATAAVKATQPQPAPPPELNPEDQRQIQVYEVMAKMNPDKYKDLPANATKYIHELDQRETEWRRDHPDATEEFDVDGSIAAALEKKYKLEFAEHDFRDAEIESRIAPVKAELETTRKKLAEAETAISTEAVQETMQKAVSEAKAVLVEELGFKDADIKKLVEDEPYVGEIVQRELQAIENTVAAAHIAFAGGSHPNANQIGQLCKDYEDAMMQLPPDEQRDENNRQFITRAQYLRLPDDQRRAIDSGTHQSYWGMNAPTAAAIGTQIIKERAKKMVEAEKERAAKYLEKHGVKKAAAPAPAPTPPPARPTPAPTPAPPPRRQVSPPSTNPSSAAAPNTAGNQVAPEFKKRFLSNANFGSGAMPAVGTS